MTTRISDEDFIKTWRAFGGDTTKIADSLGLQLRGLYFRRRSLEDKFGISLSARRDGVKAVMRKHKARINLELKDAILPIGGDVHVSPSTRTTAQRAYVAFIKRLRPKHVILVGDVFDGARISRHPRIGFLESRPVVRDELAAVGDFLKDIEQAAPRGAMLIWCLGNHDARYESYLASVAPEMEGVRGMHLKDHFPKWLPCWSVHINEGQPSHTVIKHRWHNGIHATYNNVLKAGTSFITGHLHKLDARKWNDVRGIRYGVDSGFMADLDDEQFVHYTEDNPKDWTSGFPIITYKNSRMMRPEFVQKWDEDHVEFRSELIRV